MPEIRQLPCKLTELEKSVKSQELVVKLNEKAEAEAEKKAAAADATGRIKAVQLEIDKLADQLRTGTEFREVRISEQRDEENGVILTLREDTWEQIARRLMTPEERQRKLNLIPFSKKKAEGDDEVKPVEPEDPNKTPFE